MIWALPQKIGDERNISFRVEIMVDITTRN
jgi:hypothetical protein